MNVYDFDNTVYDGESVFDFFRFCTKKQRGLLKFFPMMVKNLFKYKLNKLSIDELYEEASKITAEVIKNGIYAEILRSKESTEAYIREFWKKNARKLKQDFLDKIKEDDIIITASPVVLIEGIADIVKAKNIIGTELDLATGRLTFACFRQNKVKAFKERYPDVTIDEFYTDSLNDMPLIQLAEKAYLVKKNKEPQLIEMNKMSVTR